MYFDFVRLQIFVFFHFTSRDDILDYVKKGSWTEARKTINYMINRWTQLPFTIKEIDFRSFKDFEKCTDIEMCIKLYSQLAFLWNSHFPQEDSIRKIIQSFTVISGSSGYFKSSGEYLKVIFNLQIFLNRFPIAHLRDDHNLILRASTSFTDYLNRSNWIILKPHILSSLSSYFGTPPKFFIENPDVTPEDLKTDEFRNQINEYFQIYVKPELEVIFEKTKGFNNNTDFLNITSMLYRICMCQYYAYHMLISAVQEASDLLIKEIDLIGI